jgi:hypothetical protein
MRRIAVVVALLVVLVPLSAQERTDLPRSRDEKIASSGAGLDRNVIRVTGSETDTHLGQFDTGTLVIDRARSDMPAAPDLSCNGATADSPLDNVPFVALALEATAAANLEAVVNPDGTTLVDTVFYLYCDPFDPFDPLVNLIAVDDDDGGGPNGQFSAFTAGDGISLQPGMTYWLVMTTFGDTADLGTYQIDVSGATITTSVPVEIQSFGVE